jgi:YegS/Rv2252/BmrU family lipid kinase
MPQPWVAIQRNPSSGTGKRAHLILELIQRLRQLGITPRLYSRRADFDAAVTDPERRPQLVAAVAAGGDGTILDLVNRHPQLPLCVLPLGTENLLAKYLKIPRCGRTVAEVIAAGKRRRLDLGVLNGRHFLIMASVGFDAEIIHRVHANRCGGHVRHISYIGPILKSIWNFRPQPLRVTVDDSPTVHEGQLVVIANLSAYALNLGLVPTASGYDGLLDARIFTARSRFGLLRQFLSVLRGGQETSPSVTRLTGRRFRIESETPVPVQADGDPAGLTPATLEVEPLAVEFVVPE